MRPVLLTIIGIFVLVWIVVVLTPVLQPVTGDPLPRRQFRAAGEDFQAPEEARKTHLPHQDDRLDGDIRPRAGALQWLGPPTKPDTDRVIIPDKFIHAFRGRLIVTIGEGGKPDDILKYAQKEITIRLSDKPVPDICAYSHQRNPTKATLELLPQRRWLCPARWRLNTINRSDLK